MRLEHMHVSGDVVTPELTLLDPDAGDDGAIPFVAAWVMWDKTTDIDHTDADYTHWPGPAASANMA